MPSQQLRIVIDGRFLTQSVTGVQRVGIEFCAALDTLLSDGIFPNLDINVVIPKYGALVTVPKWHTLKLSRHGLLSGHLWEQVELPLLARGAVLLSLMNTAPVMSLLLKGSRCVVMVHDLSYRYFPEAYNIAFRTFYQVTMPVVLRCAGAIITVSQAERAAMLREYPSLLKSQTVVVAQNGVTRNRNDISPRSARGRTCLYVGSLTKRKNAANLISSAISLARYHEADVTIIGAGGASYKHVSLDIPEDVRSRIRFLGQVNDPEVLASEYQRAAVFLFPSLYEASPLPPVEAMAAGCPVVASLIPSLEERCGDAAIYCDPHSVTSILDSTTRLLDSDELWAQQQRLGLEKSEEYSWSRQAEVVIDTISSAVTRMP